MGGCDDPGGWRRERNDPEMSQIEKQHWDTILLKFGYIFCTILSFLCTVMKEWLSWNTFAHLVFGFGWKCPITVTRLTRKNQQLFSCFSDPPTSSTSSDLLVTFTNKKLSEKPNCSEFKNKVWIIQKLACYWYVIWWILRYNTDEYDKDVKHKHHQCQEIILWSGSAEQNKGKLSFLKCVASVAKLSPDRKFKQEYRPDQMPRLLLECTWQH